MTSFEGDGGGGGGFIKPSIMSPSAASTTSTTLQSSSSNTILPKARTHPLRPGSVKETAVINHIDQSILSINRRHAKKFSNAIEGEDEGEGQDEDDTVLTSTARTAQRINNERKKQERERERGYESFHEVARDIDAIVDVLWVSGTPSLQIPYLISIAGMINTYLPSYPFSPRATFRLLNKMDLIFSSLLRGEDAETGVPLSGFETRRTGLVSMTEKVRIKSLAEACRVAVVEAREQEDGPVMMEEGEDGDGSGEVDDDYDDDEEEDDNSGRKRYGSGRTNASDDVNDFDDDDDDDDDDDMEDVFGIDSHSGAPGKWEMEAARVYEKTIQLLGDELGKQGGLCDITDVFDEEVQL